MKKYMTVCKIAEICGVSQPTASGVLNGKIADHHSIRETAARFGYVPFEIRIQNMLTLRKLGYSNREIAEEIGCHYITVLHAIGKQPRAYTVESRKHAHVVGRITADLRKARRKSSIEDMRNAMSEIYHDAVIEAIQFDQGVA